MIELTKKTQGFKGKRLPLVGKAPAGAQMPE